MTKPTKSHHPTPSSINQSPCDMVKLSDRPSSSSLQKKLGGKLTYFTTIEDIMVSILDGLGDEGGGITPTTRLSQTVGGELG